MKKSQLLEIKKDAVKKETSEAVYVRQDVLARALPKELLMKYAEKELQTTLDCIHDGIYITDGEGNTLMLNQASRRFLKEDVPNLLGKNVREMVAEGYWDESICLQVIESQGIVTKVQMVEDKEILCTGIPYFENGKLVKIIATDRDISELQKMQQKLKEMQESAEYYQSRLDYYRKKNTNRDSFVYKSDVMKDVVRSAVKVAKRDVTVLIQGESGTGKEKLADLIYQNSDRREGPFVKINCASIPENLIESELFGYEKGTFTGADKEGKKGLFEVADKGTMLLDEIGELPLHLQSNLLRVLQEKEIMRVGGRKRIPIDVRIIAATNINLKAAALEGTFREDLFYRLNVIPLEIPPLRERKEDIEDMISHFLEKYGRKYKTPVRISQRAIEVFTEYGWPGNIRELKNVIERMIIIMNGEEITEEQAVRQIYGSRPMEVLETDEDISLIGQVERFEKNLLEQTMKKADSGSDLARMLHVSKSTISKKFKKYNLSY